MNSTDLLAVWPVLAVMLTGMIVLLGDAWVPFWRSHKIISASVTLIGIGVAALLAIQQINAGQSQTAFGGSIVADGFTHACNLILLTTAALAVLLAMTYLENRRLNLGEYYALVLFSTSGSMLMAAANELIVLFVAIEILSIALYVLTGFARTEQKSEEGALKYFLLGAFAAGFLLYGIALVYGGSAGAVPHGGTTNLTLLATHLQKSGAPSGMLMAGIALLLVGLGFKAGLVPFHMWTPDVYEGAPTSVTAYMAAGAKIGAFAAILRVFNALYPIADYWLIAVQILAVLTMFGGNILAVTQNNVKRMLAYSSIAHAGYLMVAVSAMASRSQAAHDNALRAASFYLLAYTLMTMGAFAVLILLSRRGHDFQTMRDLKGLARTDPPAAYIMLIFMLSLGGIPPLMGFMGKWFIFYATLQAGQTWLAIALAIASTISIYYYLRVAYMMCFEEPEKTDIEPSRVLSPMGVYLTLAVTVAGSVALGLIPNVLSPLMNAAAGLIRP